MAAVLSEPQLNLSRACDLFKYLHTVSTFAHPSSGADVEARRRSSSVSWSFLPFSQEMEECLMKNRGQTFPILNAGCDTGLGAAVNGVAAGEGISVRLARQVSMRLEIVVTKTYTLWSSMNQEFATVCNDAVVGVGAFFMAVCAQPALLELLTL